MRVYKYPFPIADEFEIAMPRGAQVLHAEAQHDTPCLWALVDETAPVEPVRFALRGTGHDANGLDAAQHVASLQHLGQFVWHLFRRS